MSGVSAERAAPRSRGIWGAVTVSAVSLAILIALGVWQLERKAWKEALIADLTQRSAAAPTPLPPPADWPRLTAAADEFRRIAVTVRFLHEREALVYTSGSTLRGGASGPGYWVFTPAVADGGATVMVNRGFVPEDRKNQDTRREGLVTAPVSIVGALRFPEARPWFAPSDDIAHNVFFVRDARVIATAKGFPQAAPFAIEQENPPPPGGLPQVARLTPTLPNNHFQYALTWFGLAAVLAVVFAVWAAGRRRALA